MEEKLLRKKHYRVLLKAKKRGIVKEVKPLIYELIEKGNYYKESFVKLVLKHAGEV